MSSDQAVRVHRFNDPEAIALEASPALEQRAAALPQPLRQPAERLVEKVLDELADIEVMYASIGATDLAAIDGNYALQPYLPFSPGYDYVGRLVAPCGGLERGTVVAGCVPRMGTWATRERLSAGWIVPVPQEVHPLRAATVGLDGVTATYAYELASLPQKEKSDEPPTLLVTGASGAVGRWLIQRAAHDGVRVYGACSPRNSGVVQKLGAIPINYTSGDLTLQVARAEGKPLDAVVTHLEDQRMAALIKREGTVVHTAWDSEKKTKSTTIRGAFDAMISNLAPGGPRHRICSVPALVGTQPKRYRRLLAQALDQAAPNELETPATSVYDLTQFAEAISAARQAPSGTKVILRMS